MCPATPSFPKLAFVKLPKRMVGGLGETVAPADVINATTLACGAPAGAAPLAAPAFGPAVAAPGEANQPPPAKKRRLLKM